MEEVKTNIPETPEVGVATGVSNLLIDLINDEWEAIQGYNNFLVNCDEYPEMAVVIQDIANEENNHVGMLQELLSKISPNAETIKEGEKEAEEELTEAVDASVIADGFEKLFSEMRREYANLVGYYNDATSKNDTATSISLVASEARILKAVADSIEDLANEKLKKLKKEKINEDVECPGCMAVHDDLEYLDEVTTSTYNKDDTVTKKYKVSGNLLGVFQIANATGNLFDVVMDTFGLDDSEELIDGDLFSKHLYNVELNKNILFLTEITFPETR